MALDIDGIPGSGGTIDGYQRMNFGGTMLPDIVYCYAGGSGWWEKAFWDGTEWNWPGWSNAGTYYGWSDTNPNDELAIPLVDIGRSADIEVWAWMTREFGGDMLPLAVHASWPAGATGSGDPEQPTMYDGIMVPTPEPASLLGMALLGLLIRRR